MAEGQPGPKDMSQWKSGEGNPAIYDMSQVPIPQSNEPSSAADAAAIIGGLIKVAGKAIAAPVNLVQNYGTQVDKGSNPADAAFEAAIPGLEGQAPEYQFKTPIKEQDQYVQEHQDDNLFGLAVKDAVKNIPKYFQDPNQSNLMAGLKTLSSLGQGVARVSAAAISSMGMASEGKFSREDTLRLMSQDTLFVSDLLDYYWRPSGGTARATRGTVGFIGDIVFDPLQWVSMGASAAAKAKAMAGKEVLTIAGRTVESIDNLSKAEKVSALMSGEIKQVLNTAGTFEKEAAFSRLEANLALDRSLAETGRVGPEIISQIENLTPEAQAQIQQIMVKRMTEGFQTGDHSVKIGMRIPLTDAAIEFDLPFSKSLSQTTAMGKGLFETAVNSADNAMSRMTGNKFSLSTLRRTGQDFLTDTSNPFFNESKIKFLAANDVIKSNVDEFVKFSADLGIAKEELPRISKALEILPDLDMVDAANTRLVKAASEGLELYNQLSPEGQKLFTRIYDERRLLRDEYKNAGISFDALNVANAGEHESTGYLRHVIHKDWLKKVGKNEDAAIAAAEQFVRESAGSNPLVDPGSFKRQFRERIDVLNQRAQAAEGVKMLVDNPIELHAIRMQEMGAQLARKKFLDEVGPLAKFTKEGTKEATEIISSRRWVRVEPDALGIIKNQGSETAIQSTRRTLSESMVPEGWRTALAEGKDIWLPEDVASRTQYLLNRSRNKTNVVVEALNTANGVMRPALLYGTGYLGQNFFSNIYTATYAGVDMKRMFDAVNLIRDGKLDKVYDFGGGLKMTGKDLMDKMREYGVRGSSVVNEADLSEIVFEAVRTSRGERGAMSGVKTAASYITGYKLMSNLAQGTDDLFKVANFMTRLDQGYSFAGAMEHTNLHFYNFKDLAPGVSAARPFMPFVTFPAKSLEFGMKSVKDLNLQILTLPPKVKHVLEGNEMMDPDSRELYARLMPEGSKDYHFWSIIPGGQAVVHEMPFAVLTSNFFLNPKEGLSPAIQMLGVASGMWGPVDPDKDLVDPNIPDQVKSSKTQQMLKMAASTLLPPPLRMAAGYAQMQDPALRKYGDIFGLLYEQDPMSIVRFAEKTDQSLTLRDPLGLKGYTRAMAGKYAKDSGWAGDLFLFGTTDEQKISKLVSMQKDASAWNMIRSEVRAMAGGMFKMSDLSRQFIVHYGALQRWENKLQNEIKSVSVQTGIFADPLNPTLVKPEQKNEKMKELVSNLKEVMRQKEYLVAFWSHTSNPTVKKSGFYQMLGEGIAGKTPTLQEREKRKRGQKFASNALPGVRKNSDQVGGGILLPEPEEGDQFANQGLPEGMYSEPIQ